MTNSDVIIIAEAGVNHNGDLNTALKMIDAASEANVDYVKFQTGKAENSISVLADKANYQLLATDSDESQLEMCKRFDLNIQDHKKLIEHCRKRKIKFLSSPFDFFGIDLLNDLGLQLIKIPSGEITNYPYLVKLGSLSKELIMSTGMATLEDVRTALNVLVASGTKKDRVTILHCNTEYPTPMEDVNLKAMLTIRNELDVAVGYSDHTLGIEIPIAAVAMGASIIEKHFTLDRNMPGPDHLASLEPEELKAMVSAIRNIEQALGDGIKRSSPSEARNIPVARKSIVAKKPIKKGERFSDDNLTVKRPGTGISPMRWNEILGVTADKDYDKDDLISK